MGMCQEANKELLARKQAEEQKKAEEERIAKEEELKKAEQERQTEIERQRAEELKAEEAKKAEELKKYNEEQAKQAEQREKEFEKLKLFARENHGEEYDEEKRKFVKIKKSEKETKSEKENKADKPDEDKKEDEEKTDSKEKEKEDKADKPKPDKETKEDQDKSKKTDIKPKAEDKPAKIKPVAPKVSNQQASPPTRPIIKSKNKKKKTVAKKKQSKNSKLATTDKTKASDTKLSQSSNKAQTSNTNTAQTSSSSKASISSLAGNTNNTSQCPIKMPQIKSAVVFQSVEAPQFELMKYQNPQPYNNYDLVMGKPAGILIELDPASMDNKALFALDFHLEGNNYFKCFHSPLYNNPMGEGKDSSCIFDEIDLKNSNSKFFPLPMKADFLQKNYSNHKVTVNLYPKGKKTDSRCRQKVKFDMRIRKTYDLKLGFTRIDGGGNCYADPNNINKGYDPVDIKKVRDFIKSKEVDAYLLAMFPVKDVIPELLRYRNIAGAKQNYVSGFCSNFSDKKLPKITIGLLEDIKNLENIRASLKYDKLIAIVPNSYFVFHRGLNHGSVGFIVRPTWEWRYLWPFKNLLFRWSFLGGSWNIIFVRDTELEKGTVAHELAHTVGQEREYYKSNEYCRQFNVGLYQPCEFYKIPIALDTWTQGKKQYWEFIKDKFSIMNNEPDIKNLWIDRETFQKTFRLLSQKAVIPNHEIREDLVYYARRKTPSLKAVVSAFYYEKESKLIIPSVKLRYTKLLTPSFPVKKENTKQPVITFKLKEGKTTLQTITRPILKMEIETLYKNKAPETKPFEFSPLTAIFNLPNNYKERDLKIVALNQAGKEIQAILVPKKREKTIIRLKKN